MSYNKLVELLKEHFENSATLWLGLEQKQLLHFFIQRSGMKFTRKENIEKIQEKGN